MSLYSETNKIKFTDISEHYAIPSQYKAKLSRVHSSLISYVVDNFRNTKKYKQKIVDALNIATYCVIESEAPPFDWKQSDPLATLPNYDIERVVNILGDYALTIDAVDWNIKEPEMPIIHSNMVDAVPPVIPQQPAKPKTSIKRSQARKQQELTQILTPKEDLFIQGPKYPRIDTEKVWFKWADNYDEYIIYTTVPEIPERQRDISVTTSVDKMTDSELMKLYPNHFIRTRNPAMYEPVEGQEFDDLLGWIPNIEGFTRDQVIDNIIRYPHLYKLKRDVEDGLPTSFFADIEIDGELLSVSTVWDTLPESKTIPKHVEFIKEYVIRRYLLEEEAGVIHRYRMWGTLKPFLTLFMPPEDYIERGYKDVIQNAQDCVLARVSYKQSRNPILRKAQSDV